MMQRYYTRQTGECVDIDGAIDQWMTQNYAQWFETHCEVVCDIKPSDGHTHTYNEGGGSSSGGHSHLIQPEDHAHTHDQNPMGDVSLYTQREGGAGWTLSSSGSDWNSLGTNHDNSALHCDWDRKNRPAGECGAGCSDDNKDLFVQSGNCNYSSTNCYHITRRGSGISVQNSVPYGVLVGTDSSGISSENTHAHTLNITKEESIIHQHICDDDDAHVHGTLIAITGEEAPHTHEITCVVICGGNITKTFEYVIS